MSCLFCHSAKIEDSFLPSTFFNQKQFDYKHCLDCDLHFLSPLPNSDDLLAMYPPAYQAGVDFSILEDPNKKLIGLRFSYGKQFDLLKKYNVRGKILDFGCGNAHFLVNCHHHNYECDGLEFNPLHVKILQEKISESKFYAFDEFMSSEIKYNCIRLSNVFEHFTDPMGTMLQIREHLNPGGYLLIEGPIEMNFNFALQARKIYFKLKKLIKKNYLVGHTPTHIIFSNRKNQLSFFEKLGFTKTHYELSEAEWPFPNSFKNTNGIIGKINFIIARASMYVSNLNRKWGNTFIYLGKTNH